jgi:hypothetical protein
MIYLLRLTDGGPLTFDNMILNLDNGVQTESIYVFAAADYWSDK